MSKPSPQLPFVASPSAKLLVSGVAGVLLGQVVLDIAARHDGSVTGLGFAMVFLLSGAASVALFLKHVDIVQRSKAQAASIHTWLLTIAVGTLLPICLHGLG